MPRIRTLKPEFWADEKLAPLPAIDRLVFLGLVSMADDCGRVVDNQKQIDAFIFPETDETSRESLAKLSRMARVRRGKTASGQRVLQICNWERHQKVDHPNRKAALPEIVEDVEVETPRESLANDSREPRESDRGSSRTIPTTYDQRPVPTTDESSVPNGTGCADQTAVATDESSGGPTFGVLIAHTRKRLWAPDGKPPAEWTEGREISVYQYFAREGYSNSEILNAIEGLYWLQQKGLVDWLPKGQKLSARVLYKRSGFRHLFGLAVDAGLKYGWSDSDPTQRTDDPRRRDPAEAGNIGAVAAGVVGTIGQRSGRTAANAR